MLCVATVDSAVNLLIAGAYIPSLIEDSGFFACVILPIYQHLLVVVSFAVAWIIRAAQRLP